MFDTIDVRIKGNPPVMKERLLRYLAVLIVSTLVLGTLYLALNV